MSGGPRRSRVDRGQSGKSAKKLAPQSAASEHVCLICAEPIKYSAVSPCNNVTCHVCCFRQRALYGKKTCLVCRTEHDDVIFTEQPTMDDSRYDGFFQNSRAIADDKHAVHFTAQYVYDDTERLLDIECPVCHEKFAKFGLLSTHVKDTHQKQYCDICATHKKAFVGELTLYTQKQLQTHLNDGDDEGFSGHPRCRFCRNKRFYSEDELNVHIRDRHERCYICDLDRNASHDYYRNYDDLYDHFRVAHYVCSIPSCVEKRFVVFREDLDLTAHMLKEHGGLTGLNGRVVIGATLSQFQSQLLTFHQQRNGTRTEADTKDVKKRRFEERAKHYLHNNPAAITKFTQINNQFKLKRLTAQQLVDEYQQLFTSENLDVSLLVYELAELYPEYSEQKTQLERAYNSLNPTAVSPSIGESFPVLGNGQSLAISNSSWGTRTKKSREEQFPALAKPSRSNSPVVKNGPVRYTVLKKPTPKPPVTIHTFSGDSSFRPSYLDKAPSESSLPILGSSSNSASSSRTLSRVQLPVPRVSSAKSLSEDKFPTLTKKSTRKEIPPVKQIPKGSGSWGQGLAPATPKPDEENWGIPIIDKKAEKLRRKQERLQKKP